MIEIKSLNKSFGSNHAVKNLSISINPGEIYGLVGPDGAGKTTTLRLIVGALKLDGGSISINGVDLLKNTEQARSQIGYLSQRFSLYEDLTVMENIRFFAEVRGISRSEWYDRSLEILAFVGLADFKDRLAGVLSGGMKQKLGLASALVGLPRVLLLDEPTTGVDPVTRQDFWQLLVRLVSQSDISKDNVTVLITTPYMDEAVRCNHIGFMQNGELIAEGSPSELRSELEGRIYEIRCDPQRPLARMVIKIPGVENVRLMGDKLHIRLQEGRQQLALEQVKEHALKQGLKIASVQSVPASLEDVFILLARNENESSVGDSIQLPAEHTNALKTLFELVSPREYEWCLSGSAGLLLQGMDVKVHDLDIQVHLDHIFKVENELSQYMISPVQVLETGYIRSLDGKASINGVEVDLIADMQVQDSSGTWHNMVDFGQKKWLAWQGENLPVIPLALEAQIYKELGRKEKFNLVSEFLKKEEETHNG